MCMCECMSMHDGLISVYSVQMKWCLPWYVVDNAFFSFIIQYYASPLLFIFLLLDSTSFLLLVFFSLSFSVLLSSKYLRPFVACLKTLYRCTIERKKIRIGWNKYQSSKYAHTASWWQKTYATWIQIDFYHTPCNGRPSDRKKEREKKTKSKNRQKQRLFYI